MSFYRHSGKRIADIVFGSIALLLFLPVIVIVSLIVYRKLGSPVFFRQERPGLYGKVFTMYKFRTMLTAYDEHGKLLPDEKRLTSFGYFLRRTSLDEIPELFNVMKGEMSIVGPRPLLEEYLQYYTEEQSRRHNVRPGITGWAQVNGRNAISWEEKFKYDVWYADHFSFFLDFKILLMTMLKVVKREGINEMGQATMSKFKGAVKEKN